MGVVNLGGRREEVVSYSPQSPVPSHQSPVTSPQSPVPSHQSPTN
ncbi:hypothetical protein [Sphaerospermopsis sp. FACHB-1094]|nr:hypothetical protein [Sphaerospermopsis sp. FACHB-1094]